MHDLDWGVVATYIGLLVTTLAFLFGAVYRMGKLAETFDVSVKKIVKLEGAMENLNHIPDMKLGIEMLNTKSVRSEEWVRGELGKIHSKITELKSRLTGVETRVGLNEMAERVRGGE